MFVPEYAKIAKVGAIDWPPAPTLANSRQEFNRSFSLDCGRTSSLSEEENLLPEKFEGDETGHFSVSKRIQSPLS